MLRRLGLKRWATRLAGYIESSGIQSLLPAAAVDTIVAEHLTVTARGSFFSERTFILSGLLSFLQFSFGPPTPPLTKRILLWFDFATVPLTEALVHELIRFDDREPRDRDTFISYAATSRNVAVVSEAHHPLACPHDRTALTASHHCPACERDYPTRDGLVFLLPDDLQAITRDYDPAVARGTPAEHL